jgi:EAL domain-containing protein (putative c-di-GMP-specific phosphodiesterase class I)/GGDEF domain-containing protein
MSLIKKLWITIIISITLAFGASIVVNTLSSKDYLETQLQMKNIDNAVALALSISQIEKDPVIISLMLSAQFDNGHYQYIRLVDPNGKLIIERVNPRISPDVPLWFTHLIHISAPAGIAQIQNGWSQYGSLSLASTTEFAYQDLWKGILIALFWNAIIAAITGLIGTLILKRILHPLSDMVSMAEAIGDKNFITIQEPDTIEFKTLAKAMNLLSTRIKVMFKDQSQLLEELRREANYDAITGLMNRKYFINRVAAHISNEESFSDGVLVVSHIANLTEINAALGNIETDMLLKKIGNELEVLCHQSSSLIAGRLSGADLAVFSKLPMDRHLLATQIKNLQLTAIGNLPESVPGIILSTTSSRVSKSDQLEGLKTLITNIQEKTAPDEIDLIDLFNHNYVPSYDNNNEVQWRAMLTTTLDSKRLKLASFPVMSTMGTLIHNESPVRLQLEKDGAWISAAEFIASAIKLDLITRIDEMVVEFAIETLAGGGQAIGLNVSTSAMCNLSYLDKLTSMLIQHPASAQHLWLEVTEDGVFSQLDEFINFCSRLKALGCKVGVKHVGAQIARLGELHDLNLDYIKIDASLVRGIDSNTGNQAFLKGLCLIAHSIGLMTIAEGVYTDREIDILPTLGIDGMTGSAIKLN